MASQASLHFMHGHYFYVLVTAPTEVEVTNAVNVLSEMITATDGVRRCEPAVIKSKVSAARKLHIWLEPKPKFTQSKGFCEVNKALRQPHNTAILLQHGVTLDEPSVC